MCCVCEGLGGDSQSADGPVLPVYSSMVSLWREEGEGIDEVGGGGCSRFDLLLLYF